MSLYRKGVFYTPVHIFVNEHYSAKLQWIGKK
jgi:hypothetical protein